MTPDALADHLHDRLGDAVVATTVAYDQLTVQVQPSALPVAAQLCKKDQTLDCNFFDFLAGVDQQEDGFAVVVQLYSVRHRHHVRLRALADGGREAPHVPTLTGVYRGADWHERETYDMFGVVFDGHPGLLPRLLTVENFEGFPLRKDFLLTSREVKPWPGAKEPEDSAKPAAEPSAAGPPPAADKAAAAKAKAERAKAKAAEARKRKAAEQAQPAAGAAPAASTAEPTPAAARAADPDAAAGASAQSASPSVPVDTDAPDEPAAAAEAAGSAIAKDAAAGVPQGDLAAGAPGDLAGVDEPVHDPAAEARAARGGAASASGVPGVEAEGIHGDEGTSLADARADAGEHAPTTPVREDADDDGTARDGAAEEDRT